MASTAAPASTAPGLRPRSATALLLPALAGGAVALSLGVYAQVHEATGEPIVDLGFSSVLAMKAWLATAAP